MRELLRQRAAPRYAEHVDGPVITQPRQQLVGQHGQASRTDTGSTGAGEPPTPGMSKMMTLTSSSAATNGSTSSRLAPMPLNMSSGGEASLPRRTATRSSLAVQIDRLDLHGCDRLGARL